MLSVVTGFVHKTRILPGWLYSPPDRSLQPAQCFLRPPWTFFIDANFPNKMCGRFACQLDPAAICRACQYQTADGQTKLPKWMDNAKIPHYRPSSNVAPTNYSPVLLSEKHLAALGHPAESSGEVGDRFIEPMRFGLIPSWHKGLESGSHLSTINCRREGIMEKNIFAVPLKKGRRCVVLAEGFYEWKKLEKANVKQPHIIYWPEEKKFLEMDKSDADASKILSERDMPVLLKFAAVFDIWHPAEGEPDVCSFSILTLDAPPSMRWIHDRMPAILSTEQDVEKWLNSDDIAPDEALKLIRPVENLAFHPVTRAMGNVAYKNPDASRPISMEQAQAAQSPLPKGQTTLTSFFSSKSKMQVVDGEESQQSPVKKKK